MTPRPGRAYALSFNAPEGETEPLDFEALDLGSVRNPYLPASNEEAQSLPPGAHFVDPFDDLWVRH